MALPVAILFAINFGMKEPILPGMKVIDLSATSVAYLNTLVQLDKVWTNEKSQHFLQARGIPTKRDELVQFLADNIDDGSKRRPKFEGIEQIPWHKLSHAYGEATDIPDYLRGLASIDPRKRKRAQSALYANIYHQGSTYPGINANFNFDYLFSIVILFRSLD